MNDSITDWLWGFNFFLETQKLVAYHLIQEMQSGDKWVCVVVHLLRRWRTESSEPQNYTQKKKREKNTNHVRPLIDLPLLDKTENFTTVRHKSALLFFGFKDELTMWKVDTGRKGEKTVSLCIGVVCVSIVWALCNFGWSSIDKISLLIDAWKKR